MRKHVTSIKKCPKEEMKENTNPRYQKGKTTKWQTRKNEQLKKNAMDITIYCRRNVV